MSILVYVALENTLCAYNEEIIRLFEEKYKPARKKDIKQLRFSKLKDNYKTNEKPLIEKLQCEVRRLKIILCFVKIYTSLLWIHYIKQLIINQQTGIWANVKPFDDAIRSLKGIQFVHNEKLLIFLLRNESFWY